jgi:PKD repeat protein
VSGDDGFTPATVRLPFARAKRISLHKLAGDPRTDDRFEERHKVETLELDAAGFNGVLAVNEKSGADARGLPPATVFCYVFEGTDLGRINRPPVAGFELPETVVAGEEAAIRNTSADADGDALSNAWTIGSLGASKEAAPTVRFAEAGIEKIELAVADAGGLSDTLTRHEQIVGLRFGGALWRPRLLPSWQGANVRARIGDAGALALHGKGPIVARGTYPVLVTDPRYRRDFSVEATIEAIGAPANDAKACAGLVLVSDLNEGLGFGWDDYKTFATPASVLVAPSGAVRVLAGQGDRLREVLPAGSVAFPVRLRMRVRDGHAVAEVQANGRWKTVGEYPDLAGGALAPGLAAGAGAGETVVTVSDLKAVP